VGTPATYVGFLRAVNVGGRTVAMGDLREAVEAVGCSSVRTLLNSGNVVFRTPERRREEVERRLEAGCAPSLGLPVEFMVRDLPGLEAAIAANPFARFARDDPGHLLLVFLKSTPSAKVGAAWANGLAGPEEALVRGAVAYVTYPLGIGTSKLTLTRIEAALGTRGTGRNWNTVNRLASLARELEAEGRRGG
jgi:uncharacterized protein (DUF1697 family)